MHRAVYGILTSAEFPPYVCMCVWLSDICMCVHVHVAE